MEVDGTVIDMQVIDELRKEHDEIVKEIGTIYTWSEERLLQANEKLKQFKRSITANRAVYNDCPSEANKLVLVMIEQGYAKFLRGYVDNLIKCYRKEKLIRRLDRITQEEIDLLENIKTSLLLELE